MLSAVKSVGLTALNGRDAALPRKLSGVGAARRPYLPELHAPLATSLLIIRQLW